VNATDVYVEQLIIGGIVVAIAVVLWTGVLPPLDKEWGQIAVYVAIAYLAGLIYDRVGDTLLERIEQRQRLEFAIKQWRKNRGDGDPYPEDRYRAYVLAQGEELARQYNYLRTRVRLTRAVASLLPAGTVAVLVHDGRRQGWVVTLGVIASYALVAAVNAYSSDLARTDSRGFKKYAARKSRWLLAYGSSIAGLAALLLLMLTLARNAASLAIIAAGIAATILAGWVWIRITGTFMAFLRDAFPSG
jgi:hypothetical protein